MSKFNLYPYQEDALNSVIDSFHNKQINKQLIVLPTGAGKTILFGAIATTLNKKTLIIAHREELLQQAQNKIKRFWPDSSLNLYLKNNNDLSQTITISSIQTCSQKNRLAHLKKINFRVLIIDEAHHATSSSYRKVIKELGFLDDPNKLLLGVTATPIRADKQNLNEIFPQITYSISIEELIDQKYLSPVKARRINTKLRIKKISSRLGDFAIEELALAVNIPERNYFIVSKCKEHALNKKTIVFCTNVQHCKDLALEFKKQGIKAAAVWGDMPHDERKKIIKKFKRGRIKVILSCSLLTEGFDCETIECVVMARPTKSKPLYIQMVGRGLRVDKRKNATKKDCLVLDFTDIHNNLSSIASIQDIIANIEIINDNPILKNQANNLSHNRRFITNTFDIDEEFNILDDSQYIWIKLPNEYSLAGENSNEIIISKKENGFVAHMFFQNRQNHIIVANPTTLQECKRICEEFATQCKIFKLAQLYSPWMIAGKKVPATKNQINVLNGYGIYEENLSKSEVSLKIRQHAALLKYQRRQNILQKKKPKTIYYNTYQEKQAKMATHI